MVCYSGGFRHQIVYSPMTHLWFSKPQLASKNFQNTFLKPEYQAKPVTDEDVKLRQTILPFKHHNYSFPLRCQMYSKHNFYTQYYLNVV